jgi:hypothetical protein
MATKKTTEAAKTEAVEAKATVEASAAEKKATAKKAAPKKTAAPKKEAAPKKPNENVYVQYQGVELTSAGLIERAKAESGVKSPKKVDVYVKPEDNTVYYVVDNNAGQFPLVD